MKNNPQPAHNAAAIDWSEFRLGWRILLLATFGVAVNANASMLYAFGSLVMPLQKAFGWERGELQGAVSFLFAGAVVGAQVVGWLNQRYGMRRVTVISLITLSAVFALTTLMGRSIGWLYFFFALMAVASMGTMQVTWTQLVNVWFERNRGLGLALVLSGTGLSAAFIPLGVTWSVERWGWQAAFLFLGLLPLVLVLPLALRWMSVPAKSTATAVAADRSETAVLSGVTFREGIRSLNFWVLNIALCLVVAAVVTMVTNTVPLLRDKGLSASDASKVFGGFGLSLIFGRVLVGYLIDRLWAPGVAAVALALPAFGCLLLWHTGAPDFYLLMLATFLLGIGAGAEFDIAAYLCSRYFGLRDYGRLFGLHLGLITTAAALAPLLFGAIYKATGAYSIMLALCGAAFLLGALMLLPLGRAPDFSSTK
jgi:MFS family permease